MKLKFAGNARIIASVENFISEHRIPHAIIINGAKGTGRHTLCRYIANAAICSAEDAPCGKCRECTVFLHNNHPDVSVTEPLEGKKNISVAQIRELRNSAFVKPHMSGKKVFIIDYADTLNEQSQNALLKILEEPPQDVLFLLITENAASLLDTIISRCVTLDLTLPDITEALDYISAETDYEKEDICAAVKKSGGNIGEALLILGESGDSANTPALIFAEMLFNRESVYELLKTVYPLEKSRKDCEAFIKELKGIILGRIRSEYDNPPVLSRMMRFYDVIIKSEPALLTNINISLYLSALVCRLKESY